MAIVVVLIVLLLLGALALYVHDRHLQNQHAILRNYPVIGHFRYFFENLGEYFRQYWFAMDWEERPFNRSTRAWVYRSAKRVSNYIAYGTETDYMSPSEITFLHSAFPINDEEARPFSPQPIGAGFCSQPYLPKSFFNISHMSYGALSIPAVRALSAGAAASGIWLGTGEGGLSPHHLSGGCDIVFEIGTAKYGVRDAEGHLDDEKLAKVAAEPQVKMIEIKMSQGAKPGKGGILPAAKVTAEIAEIRGIPMGQDSISPNRHSDVHDVPSLLALIARVRQIADKPVGIKFCLGDERFLDDLFQACTAEPGKAPDFITIDGGEGGTGAAPAPLADHVGRSIHEALPMLVARRAAHGLTERIKIVAAGKLIKPNMVGWALATGADYVVSARGFMLSLGCIQSLKCNTGRCPTGITTPDPRFTQGLDPADKAVRVAAYAKAVIHDVEIIAHACGCRDVSELKAHHVRVAEGAVSRGPFAALGELTQPGE